MYPTVRIDSTGIWIRYSGPLSQPEPLTGAAPSAPAAEEEDPLYFEGDPYELPEEAWTNPAAFARRHTPSSIPKSAEAHDIGDPESPPKRSAAEEGARESKAARLGTIWRLVTGITSPPRGSWHSLSSSSILAQGGSVRVYP